MRREWIEMQTIYQLYIKMASPSMRREWIEMSIFFVISLGADVSLHAEGVD